MVFGAVVLAGLALFGGLVAWFWRRNAGHPSPQQRAAELELLARSGVTRQAVEQPESPTRPPWWRIALTVLFLLAIVAFIVVMLNNGATIPVWSP
ncbi:hypothetical protein [Prauserella endophytica]|uniref:Uncharacterized protein n=1 Tax=Prauserella endophytica TaxID=1592324 RepID=A0ABY2RUZ7_9PSEU|nr:hypothetical protein [Prauserella endophytica]TKG61535.1 hypothetical protein FCN18_33390 [Prauserella endophytica]